MALVVFAQVLSTILAVVDVGLLLQRKVDSDVQSLKAGSILTLSSIRSDGTVLVGCPVPEHGQHVHSASGQGDNRLLGALPFGALMPIVLLARLV